MGNGASVQQNPWPSRVNSDRVKRGNQPENSDKTRYSFTEPIVVIAIDFGTINSGYAFCLKCSPIQIRTGTHGGVFNEDRVPTVVLLNPNKSFNSFGNEAQDKYWNLSEEERKEYFYVEHFKMALYRSGKLTRETTIYDIKGKEINALHVFTETIKFFYEKGLEMANLTHTSLSNKTLEAHHIQWILTIPAIWTTSARQFMREAATAAGIREDRLRLVLEPEAASLFCQETKLRATWDQIEQLPVGHKYILADLGGGTADICVHEIIEYRNLRELFRATGGDLGGNNVNTAYVGFIQELFGINVWETLIEKHPDIYCDIMKFFENKKKTFSIKTKSITLNVEQALVKILANQTNQSLQVRIKNSRYKDSVIYTEETEKLIIMKSLFETFYRPTVNGIVDKIKEILQACNDPELETLMLVGGFADSPYVREHIQENFQSLSLILHNEMCLAVLKGAVLMGFMPRSIMQRRARFTYGFSHRVAFIPGEHIESLKLTVDGEDKCAGVFEKIIEKDQLLQYGDKFTFKGYGTAWSIREKHKKRIAHLWRSNRRSPVYCWDEPGEEDCEKVGRITLRPPAGGWPDYWEYEQQLIVGETEFTMRSMNTATGEDYSTQVNFL